MIPGAEPAGLLRRVGAMIYDGLLVIAMWMSTLYLLVALAGDVVAGPAVQSLLFVEAFVFFAYFWIVKGQTLGMLAWKLSITTLEGNPPSLRQALMRFLVGIVSLTLFGLGFLWILFDPMKRGWPDLVSGTRIYHLREPSAGS